MSCDKLVSIIIPVYNVDKYIHECVDSCLKQTYINIEVLLIDDGSTDNSSDICDWLEKSNKKVHTYHKVNGGLSDARNYGLNLAKGEYITFVDSDDLIHEDMISVLVRSIQNDDSDVVSCELTRFYDEEGPSFLIKTQKKVFLKESAILSFLYQKEISTSSCAKLYKKNMLTDIKFVKGQRFEDNLFVFRLLQKCSKISWIESSYYAYRQRNRSITNKEFDEKDFDILDIGRELLSKTSTMSIEIQKAAIIYQYTNSVRVYLKSNNTFSSHSMYKYCQKYIKNNSKVIARDKNARASIRIVSILFLLGCPLLLISKLQKFRNKLLVN